ncbi:hypothetical protein A2368_04710 [Candidatus Collierbacteria bacterium RIFOXYB1_FULL_49_13]|uniref:SpoVT-AbrB domain-containing protein n=1 Tax=Candidatus Collierbacteria bacterium RIFOXYB1_FULL_49_13 TaxID=1817728 RepID=A0A1F5FJT2_9BACT|nr:MAG: hypothetical protein A2368_04710 [Candidatus Collierbacteria bacterium RIFOXYB1_FULL_49_13]
MTYLVSITSQGQLSIPVKVRRQLGLTKPGKAIINVHDDHFTVEPVRDILSLKGILRGKKADMKAIRQGFEQYLADEGMGIK